MTSFSKCLLVFTLCASSANAIAQPPASSGADRPRLTAADMREDIAAFRTEFLARDNSYSVSARAQAETELKKLESVVESITPVTFELTISRIVALADNGHTMAGPSVRERHFNHVPIRVSPFGAEFRVIRATDATADLLGARLTAIDRHPISQLVDSARTLMGGPSRWRDRFANILFESPEQLHAMGLAANAASATYSFQTTNGRMVDRQLTGESANSAADRVPPHRWLAPAFQPTGSVKWHTVLGADKVPWSLAEPDVPFRWRAAPEIDALVIDLRQTVSSPGHSIAEFLTEMSGKLQAQRPRNLVLDMRLNGGGNLQTARDFMKSLPILVPGRIFVLTSPWTFSAAISSVGYLEQAAPDRVTIVGEEVGDRLEFWAEGRGATLPRSGLMMGFATQRHDYRNGCRAFTDCHGAVVQHPIAVPSLAPDIAAPWTFEAYRAGRDPAMEAVAAALGR